MVGQPARSSSSRDCRWRSGRFGWLCYFPRRSFHMEVLSGVRFNKENIAYFKLDLNFEFICQNHFFKQIYTTSWRAWIFTDVVQVLGNSGWRGLRRTFKWSVQILNQRWIRFGVVMPGCERGYQCCFASRFTFFLSPNLRCPSGPAQKSRLWEQSENKFYFFSSHTHPSWQTTALILKTLNGFIRCHTILCFSHLGSSPPS